MAGSHSRNVSSLFGGEGEEGVLGSALNTRQIEAFGKKVTATASHLMGDTTSNNHYPHAIGHLSRQMQRPGLQRNVFSLAQTSPRDLVRSKLSTSEISHRAVTHLSNDILGHIPENASPYSLFQGFQATLPEGESDHRKSHRRRSARIQKLLADTSSDTADPPSLDALRKERNLQDRRLEMMAVRKNLCSTEIHGIDAKIANLSNMRKIVLDRLADLENDEAQAEHELSELDSRIESIQEEMDEAQSLHQSTSTVSPGRHTPPEHHSQSSMDASFMSESIYEKLPPVPPKKSRRPRPGKRKSMPVLHEHLQPGSNLKNLPAHNDAVTALDFDMPFGTMVTAALDDTLRVWDLNLSRCIGFLEGHTASVRCLQVEDDMVASGGMDASIRLWNLSRARYEPYESDREGVRRQNLVGDNDDDALGYNNPDADEPPPPPANSLEECPLFVLEAHVDAVTALHMRGDTLVSGSADKTLRQWDLVKGRCVQTLDVLWAAAQASATLNPVPNVPWKPTMTAAITSMPSAAAASSRVHNANADFVGALQCFDAALACGTADGMVRLWDLRSGQVHRSLVGHTGPVTCLQFDDTHLVTGSADRSIRIWDLRTGSIHDAYAYTHPISDMSFDSRRIVAAAGESSVKIYDKSEGRHWDCGGGDDRSDSQDGGGDGEKKNAGAIVDHVRVKDGYLIEGRRDGVVGVWTC